MTKISIYVVGFYRGIISKKTLMLKKLKNNDPVQESSDYSPSAKSGPLYISTFKVLLAYSHTIYCHSYF